MSRPIALLFAASLIFARATAAQTPDTTKSATFLNRSDLLVVGAAVAATGILSIWDDNIAQWSQKDEFQGSRLRSFTTNASKVNETTLTAAGLLAYGIGRLSKSKTVADIALHTTESVVLASLASQAIRGPLGRTRPYVTNDSDQYDFHFMKGFTGHPSFDFRSFPSIHMSSSMAVATALTMETNRRKPSATVFVAPVLYAAALLPGLSRIELNQHWASDIFAGAFMGIFAGYKVVSYSHDHPDNRFDRTLLKFNISPDPKGGVDFRFDLY